MKILHVISNIDPTSGGVAAASTGLALAQLSIGLQPSMMSTYPADRSPAAAEPLRQSGLEVRVVGPCPGRINRHPLIRPTLEEALRNIDIVHIHGIWEQVQHDAARMAQRKGIPYVISPHGMLGSYSLSRSPWIKKFWLTLRVRRNLNHAAAIHYTADAEREQANPLGLDRPIILEPNGLDLGEFDIPPVRGRFRERFGIASGRTLVLFLGRLHPIKGLDLLIPAFARCIKDFDSEHKPLLVIGGPDTHGYRSTVETMAKAHGIEQHIVFTGMLKGGERIEAYFDCDLFALPSYHENFGIVVAEAMAAGKPVIISDKVSIDRDVKQSGAGAVVPTKVEPLASAMSEWLIDPIRCHAAGQCGREFAFQQYGFKAIAERWKRHFEQILAASHSRHTELPRSPRGAQKS